MVLSSTYWTWLSKHVRARDQYTMMIPIIFKREITHKFLYLTILPKTYWHVFFNHHVCYRQALHYSFQPRIRIVLNIGRKTMGYYAQYKN